jgi:hypothetical protein
MRTHMATKVEGRKQREHASRKPSPEVISPSPEPVVDAPDITRGIPRVPGEGVIYFDPFTATALPNRRDAIELLSHCESVSITCKIQQ